MTTTTTAPAGYTQKLDTDGTVMCFDGPVVQHDGYRLLHGWSPERGHFVFIDHDNDNPFTDTELVDLVAVLQQTLDSRQG